MTPFVRAKLDARSKEKTVAALVDAWKRRDPAVIASIKPDATIDDVIAAAEAICEETAQGEIWMNDLYQVNLRACDGMVHLSIRRLDREAIHDWRHFQRIKNELVGPECEGVELYPAESRLCDSANQYHLWVLLDPTERIPVGWDVRAVTGESLGNGKQRPFEKS